MLGCFGRRKKSKNKDASKPTEKVASKGSAPESKSGSKLPANDGLREPAVSKDDGNKKVSATPQITVESHPPPQGDNSATADTSAEVAETITVTRSQSMHHAPSKPGNIKKAATMSRYDFLRKQDNVNYADRWASLKQRYLAGKAENGDVVGRAEGPEQQAAKRLSDQPKSPHRALAHTLPRQFSPTSPDGPPSPVKFSDWFYDRQAREAEARREVHDREERIRKIIEGPSQAELEEAAVKIQAGYKGYRTRKEMKARREGDDEASPAADEAAAAEKTQQEAEPQEQPTGEAQEGNPEEEIDLNDPELAQAATKIQAGFKGYQTRKKLKDEAGQNEEHQDEAKDADDESPAAAVEDSADKTDDAKPEAAEEAETSAEAIDPNDPAQNLAASKIQAGFRGMQARKEVAEIRKSRQETEQQQQQEQGEEEADASVEGKAEEAEPAADSGEAEPEPEAEPEAEAQPEPEAEPEAEAQPEAEPEAEAQPEADAAEAEPAAQPEAEEPQTEVQQEAEAEAEPEAPPAEPAAVPATGGVQLTARQRQIMFNALQAFPGFMRVPSMNSTGTGDQLGQRNLRRTIRWLNEARRTLDDSPNDQQAKSSLTNQLQHLFDSQEEEESREEEEEPEQLDTLLGLMGSLLEEMEDSVGGEIVNSAGNLIMSFMMPILAKNLAKEVQYPFVSFLARALPEYAEANAAELTEEERNRCLRLGEVYASMTEIYDAGDEGPGVTIQLLNLAQEASALGQLPDEIDEKRKQIMEEQSEVLENLNQEIVEASASGLMNLQNMISEELEGCAIL